MTRTSGTIVPGETKELYVGLSFPYDVFGITGVAFSVWGIREDLDGISVLGVEPLIPNPSVVIGNPPAPADTSAGTKDTGGIAIAWGTCVGGSGPRLPLVKLQIRSTSDVTHKTLRVLPHYPPTSPPQEWGLSEGPFVGGCDDCFFCFWIVSGGSYILNPAVGVRPTTWSAVRQLFR